MICIHFHHYWVIQTSFIALQIPCAASLHLSLPAYPWQLLIFFAVFIVLPFPECYIFGLIHYVAFLDCLVSFSNMHLKFLCVFLWLDSSYYCWLIFHCMDVLFLINLPSKNSSFFFKTTLFYFISLKKIVSFFFCFLGPHLWHMEIPKRGVESELQFPA